MNLQTSRAVGGIGALLIVLGVIPGFIGISDYGAVRAIGIIFILISLYKLANIHKNKSIFTNAFIGGAIIIGSTFVSTLAIENWLMSSLPDFNNISAILSFVGTLLTVFIVFVIFLIIAAFFVRRSLNELAVCSDTDQFAGTGKLLLVGAVLTIIAIGILIVMIAFIMLAIAFFKMKEPQHTPPATIEPTTTI
ncbi:MAG: DUF996 domain-containing protein [Nitrososphaerota archaeon]|jgi:uncharacterized membrane protein|nr:DUF996 domain-containing protein [Nitrososphaerota archaeon]